jgi:hypothetical protein
MRASVFSFLQVSAQQHYLVTIRLAAGGSYTYGITAVHVCSPLPHKLCFWLYCTASVLRFMRLDAAASRALNVLPQRLDGSASFSLYGIMARGKTAMGKRLLKVRCINSL